MFSLSPNQIAIDSIGRIVISGNFRTLLARQYDLQGPMVARLDSNGIPDNTFGQYYGAYGFEVVSSPQDAVRHATSLVLKSDNKILLGGYLPIEPTIILV